MLAQGLMRQAEVWKHVDVTRYVQTFVLQPRCSLGPASQPVYIYVIMYDKVLCTKFRPESICLVTTPLMLLQTQLVRYDIRTDS